LNIKELSSITKATNIKFIKVPKPGFSLRNIHKNKTKELTKRSAIPIDKSKLFEIPSDKTLYGELPIEDNINKPSPRLTNKRPIKR